MAGSREWRRLTRLCRWPKLCLPRLEWSELAADLMGLAGLPALFYGLWLWWEPAAWIVGGLVLLAPTGLRMVERLR